MSREVGEVPLLTQSITPPVPQRASRSPPRDWFYSKGITKHASEASRSTSRHHPLHSGVSPGARRGFSGPRSALARRPRQRRSADRRLSALVPGSERAFAGVLRSAEPVRAERRVVLDPARRHHRSRVAPPPAL